jgi:uncharacterized protein YciI
VNFFVYCRDRPGAGELRDQTLEAHWSYMDGFAEGMVARGPTLADDRETATGSLHIVDLPDPEAARAFAFEEPNYRAGVYREVLIRRWLSVLGATMWEFDGDEVNNRRFLVLGHGKPEAVARRDQLRDAHHRHLLEGPYREHLIALGPLLSDDASEWLGVAILIELRDRAKVDSMLASDPYVEAGLFDELEIHDWEFGGRR